MFITTLLNKMDLFWGIELNVFIYYELNVFILGY